MDDTKRQITKIAREVGKFTVQTMKEEGIGTAEFDVIHLVRHNPGITQTKVRESLKMDKGAAAKRVARLENKGYLVRKPNPEDGRSQLLYATEKAEHLKNSKTSIETVFYEWLLEDLSGEEKEHFCKTLDMLYWQKRRMTGMENKELQKKREDEKFCPEKIGSYFRVEWKVLLTITISGLIYNLGLLAEPWFEGRMTGMLVDILRGSGTFANMLFLVIGYVAAIGIVQVSRYVKRFYVRRFANNVNRRIKEILYHSLVTRGRASLREEGEGTIMTKAIRDVDDCVEGMRKFTTEIFDTGVALTAYAGMLLWYDWRLALLCMIFPPISYITAEKMKRMIQRTGAAYKKQCGVLSAVTLDRAQNAVTYRVFGCERDRQMAYEKNLTDYETSAVKANIWNSAMPPIYKVISMTSVLFILYFGQKNTLGSGWSSWSIATFTTFLACFVKLSTKSSSAAKLFNAVHKAQVSWNRIRPLFDSVNEEEDGKEWGPGNLEVKDVSFAYPDGKRVLEHVSFSAKPGQIIGVTGPVACGKSTLGKLFLCECPYEGTVRFAGKDLLQMEEAERKGIVVYLGHDPELFHDSVRDNVLLGDEKDLKTYLKAVCIDREVSDMEEGEDTLIGNGGVRLSGGQAQRVALARTLCHKKPLLVLDDPFSALDKSTEKEVFANVRAMTRDSIVLLLSHRLYLFPQMDQIIWMDEGKTTVGTHEELLQKVSAYATLFTTQEGEDSHEA